MPILDTCQSQVVSVSLPVRPATAPPAHRAPADRPLAQLRGERLVARRQAGPAPLRHRRPGQRVGEEKQVSLQFISVQGHLKLHLIVGGTGLLTENHLKELLVSPRHADIPGFYTHNSPLLVSNDESTSKKNPI